MREIKFENGEYYHIFNRGAEKRDIFTNREGFGRFLQGMKEFNTITPIGSIYAASYREKQST